MGKHDKKTHLKFCKEFEKEKKRIILLGCRPIKYMYLCLFFFFSKGKNNKRMFDIKRNLYRQHHTLRFSKHENINCLNFVKSLIFRNIEI